MEAGSDGGVLVFIMSLLQLFGFLHHVHEMLRLKNKIKNPTWPNPMTKPRTPLQIALNPVKGQRVGGAGVVG